MTWEDNQWKEGYLSFNPDSLPPQDVSVQFRQGWEDALIDYEMYGE